MSTAQMAACAAANLRYHELIRAPMALPCGATLDFKRFHDPAVILCGGAGTRLWPL